MKKQEQIILATLLAIIVLGAFAFTLDRFLNAREQEQEFGQNGSITFSADANANDVSNLPRPVLDYSTTTVTYDDTKSSISLGDGRSVIASLDTTSTTTEDVNSLTYTSRLSIVNSNGVVKEIYKYKDLMAYLRIHKLSSDKNRLYFYAKPDGLGGYYPIPAIVAKKFFEYNFKTGVVKEIIVKNSAKLKMQRLEDVSDDGNIVAFTSWRNAISNTASSSMVVFVYYVKENKTFDLPSWEKEGYRISGGAKFEGNDKITYYTAVGNPDAEHIKTIEYDLRTKTYKILKSE